MAADALQLGIHPTCTFAVAERSSKHEDSLVDLFQTLNVDPDEIRAATQGRSFKEDGQLYDYAQSFVPMLLDKTTNTVACAGIVVKKEIRQHTVFELIWFATAKFQQGHGYGGLLFKAIRRTAAICGASAILCISSNKATAWWLSHKNVCACDTILRAKSSGDLQRSVCGKTSDIETQRVKMRDNTEWDALEDWTAINRFWAVHKNCRENSEKHAPTKCRHHAQVCSCLESLFSNGDLRYKIEENPPACLRHFYVEKGMKKDSKDKWHCKDFLGRPYRYGTNQANHVWFPVVKWVDGEEDSTENMQCTKKNRVLFKQSLLWKPNQVGLVRFGDASTQRHGTSTASTQESKDSTNRPALLAALSSE
jgi:hypothetical protein